MSTAHTLHLHIRRLVVDESVVAKHRRSTHALAAEAVAQRLAQTIDRPLASTSPVASDDWHGAVAAAIAQRLAELGTLASPTSGQAS